MKQLDDFYLNQEEPIKGIMIALRDIILKKDTAITAEWKYKLPFFYYKGKMFCYLWIHKKLKQVYIGFANGEYLDEPFLVQENRKKMKVMLFDSGEDLPLEKIENVLDKAINLYKTGIVKV